MWQARRPNDSTAWPTYIVFPSHEVRRQELKTTRLREALAMTPDVQAAVTTAIQTVLRDTGRSAATVSPEMLLSTDLGLDSLDLAQTVVLLERSLGTDPFRQAGGGSTVRTVGDLVAIYSAAIG
jgi:acyl carrier protein